MKYTVEFVKKWAYDVEAGTAEEAQDLAYTEFQNDAINSVTTVHYDECNIEELKIEK